MGGSAEALAERVAAAGARCSLTKSLLADWGVRGTPRQVEYLAEYLEAECASRDASRKASLLRRCALPQAKAFDGYDWTSVSRPEGFGRADLLSLSFLERREDLVLMGDVGTGKTHMLEAICSLCCQQMRPARFFTASSLVMRLRRARDAGSLDRELAQLAKADILGIDELGFLPLDSEAALPSHIRELRAAVPRDHHEPRVRALGRRLRGRPDGCRRDRPHLPSREASEVQRRVLAHEACPHIGRQHA